MPNRKRRSLPCLGGWTQPGSFGNERGHMEAVFGGFVRAFSPCQEQQADYYMLPGSTVKMVTTPELLVS